MSTTTLCGGPEDNRRLLHHVEIHAVAALESERGAADEVKLPKDV